MQDVRMLDEIFDRNGVRPMRGYVICEKYIETSRVYVDGFGWVDSRGFSDGGLLLVSKQTQEQEYVNATRYVVRRIGTTPYEWRFRCLSTGGSWNGPRPGDPIERNFHTTFAQQRVVEGTVLAARAVSGTQQDRASRFVALRYDEICAIGKPLDEPEGFEMLPAPGWVLVQKESSEARKDRLEVYEGLQQMIQNGNGTWGRILEIPREVNTNGLRVGDRVMFPTHAAVGATEYIEFGGGIRCLPLEDVLLVQEA